MLYLLLEYILVLNPDNMLEVLVDLMLNSVKIYKKFSGMLINLKDIVIYLILNGQLQTKVTVVVTKIKILLGDSLLKLN